jgi:uncharacterized membrane protein YeiH
MVHHGLQHPQIIIIIIVVIVVVVVVVEEMRRHFMMFHCLFQFGVMGIYPPTGMQHPILMITTPTTTIAMHMMILTRKWRQ